MALHKPPTKCSGPTKFDLVAIPARTSDRASRTRPRRAIAAAVLRMSAAAATQVGCFVPIYSSSPDVRARELIYQSENLRHIPAVWERIWGLDMPDVETPYRTHGGVI